MLDVLFLKDEFAAVDGGTEQHMLYLMRELPQRGIHLHFALLGRLGRCDEESFLVPPVLLSDPRWSGRRGTLRRVRRLASHLRTLRPEIVHAFCATSELLALVATRLAGCGKVLGVRRNLGYWHTPRTLWRARLASRFGTRYVANCEAARQFAARAEWIPLDRISVIRNPAPWGRWEEAQQQPLSRDSLTIRDGEQAVAMVATVRPVKDYATFLKAAQRVLEVRPRTRFLALGDSAPEYFAQLQSLTRDLDIQDQVSWLGVVANPLAALAHCDVAVLSSQSEALSNALLEYAVAGVPAVATDVGGSREVVEEGRTGFLVPPESPDLMAERILRLLDDASLRARFGAEAQRRAETQFSEDHVLDQYADLYRRLAGATGSPADLEDSRSVACTSDSCVSTGAWAERAGR